MGTRGLPFEYKRKSITHDIPGILGALWQVLGTKTKYISKYTTSQLISITPPRSAFYTFLAFIVPVCSVAQSCLTLCDPMDCSPPGSSVHVKKIGVGCHFLLQGICRTQGLNPYLLSLLHWQVDYLPLSHLGSLYRHMTNDLLIGSFVYCWLFPSRRWAPGEQGLPSISDHCCAPAIQHSTCLIVFPYNDLCNCCILERFMGESQNGSVHCCLFLVTLPWGDTFTCIFW